MNWATNCRILRNRLPMDILLKEITRRKQIRLKGDYVEKTSFLLLKNPCFVQKVTYLLTQPRNCGLKKNSREIDYSILLIACRS